MKSLYESLFDIDDNEKKLNRTIDIYKNAINIIKHKPGYEVPTGIS